MFRLLKEDQYIDEMNGVPKKILTQARGHQVFAEQKEGSLNAIAKSQLLHPQIISMSKKFVTRCKVCDGSIVRKQVSI